MGALGDWATLLVDMLQRSVRMLAVAYTMASHAGLASPLLAFDQHRDLTTDSSGSVVRWTSGGATTALTNQRSTQGNKEPSVGRIFDCEQPTSVAAESKIESRQVTRIRMRFGYMPITPKCLSKPRYANAREMREQRRGDRRKPCPERSRLKQRDTECRFGRPK